MKNIDEPAWFAPYVKIRPDGYVMLASLLGQPPSVNLLKVLGALRWGEPIPEEVDRSLRALCEAGHGYPLSALRDEYDRLFVGLGCGELIPYASWYREKRIQSSALVSLRSDLVQLGIVKQINCHEPEDHASALCECMALISGELNSADHPTQARFFQRHIEPWMTAFFKDLESAKSARFYRAVGAFGSRFMEAEIEYLKGRGGA